MNNVSFSEELAVQMKVSVNFPATVGSEMSTQTIGVPVRLQGMSHDRQVAVRRAILKVSDAEEQGWHSERQALLEKHFASGLSGTEEKRLRYVTWHLHQIDEARLGPSLDRLEVVADRFEQFKVGITNLLNELDSVASSKRY